MGVGVGVCVCVDVGGDVGVGGASRANLLKFFPWSINSRAVLLSIHEWGALRGPERDQISSPGSTRTGPPTPHYARASSLQNDCNPDVVS